jgi:hypothetical protein
MSDRDFVIYNGRPMAPEWPARIEAAQAIDHYLIGGQRLARIRYGKERHAWPDGPCHDCGVLKGQFHVEQVCDTEECPKCGGQAIGCTCPYASDPPLPSG